MIHNRILIVDRDASYSRAFFDSLVEKTRSDFKMSRAGSIREAREKARGFYPDAVVTAAMLVDGDAYDLYTELRADREQLPVFFICANDDESARLRGLGVPAYRWAGRKEAKDVLPERLVDDIQNVYERPDEYSRYYI